MEFTTETKDNGGLLTSEEKQLLKKIMEDKYSNGAFSGMIFNAYMQGGNSIEKLIKDALNVRLTADRLAR